MRFREHRGGLAESMETVIEFNTAADLSRHLQKVRPDIIESGARLKAEPLFVDDSRIGWKDVHIVIAYQGGVIGFIDGPMPR